MSVFKKRIKWYQKQERMNQISGSREESGSYFGYEPVSLDEKAMRVLKHFRAVSKRYDFMNTLLSFGIHYAWKRRSVRMLSPEKADRVLDLCAGTADLGLLAAGRVGPAGLVVLYDINRDMMEAGKKKVLRSEFDKRAVFVQGDAQKLSFPDESFHAAMVGFGIRNLPEPRKGFEEMYRVLKPGGKMMCLEFSRPTWELFRWTYDIYSFYVMPFLGEILAGSRQAYTHLPESIRTFPLPDELSGILEEIGFSSVSYERLTNGIAVIHRAVKHNRKDVHETQLG